MFRRRQGRNSPRIKKDRLSVNMSTLLPLHSCATASSTRSYVSGVSCCRPRSLCLPMCRLACSGFKPRLYARSRKTLRLTGRKNTLMFVEINKTKRLRRPSTRRMAACCVCIRGVPVQRKGTPLQQRHSQGLRFLRFIARQKKSWSAAAFTCSKPVRTRYQIR